MLVWHLPCVAATHRPLPNSAASCPVFRQGFATPGRTLSSCIHFSAYHHCCDNDCFDFLQCLKACYCCDFQSRVAPNTLRTLTARATLQIQGACALHQPPTPTITHITSDRHAGRQPLTGVLQALSSFVGLLADDILRSSP